MIWLIPAVLLMCAVLLAFAFERGIRADMYPPEAAEAPDPVDQQLDVYERAKYFTDEEAVALQATAPRDVPYVLSDHPTDCALPCCWEIRLDELHDAFDWHAAEHEMRSKR